MALTEEQADSVVQNSVPQAGGGNGPHNDGKTLAEAGLKLLDQRRAFRRRCSINVEEFDHTLGVNQVPFDASTTISQARKAVKDKSQPR